MLKDPKNISLFFIPYFTICGALYHIGYWDTFNLNGLSYLSLSEIIKSSAYPIIWSLSLSFFGMFIGQFIIPLDKVFPKGEGKNTYLGKKANSKIGVSIVLTFWVIVVYITYRYGNYYHWLSWAFFTSLVPYVWLDNNGLWENAFPSEKIRTMAIHFLVYLPLFSFAIGKVNSEEIKLNHKYQYCTNNYINSLINLPLTDTIKFLGNTDKHFLFTDIKNTAIYMINTDDIKSVTLKEKRRLD